jgi:hypothetical protein
LVSVDLRRQPGSGQPSAGENQSVDLASTQG